MAAESSRLIGKRKSVIGFFCKSAYSDFSIAFTRLLCHIVAMRFNDLISHVPSHGVFRTGQILSGQAKPASVGRQLDRWCKSGRVLQLRRGVYAIEAKYARQSPHPFLVANILKRASYVSLQSALSHYGMIPEYVPTTTSITTGRPERLQAPLGRFEYRHIAKRLFTGFHEIDISPDMPVLIASPEKALIDLLYLTPNSDKDALLRELRVTPHPSFANETVLLAAADAGASGKVIRAVKRLLAIWQEETK